MMNSSLSESVVEPRQHSREQLVHLLAEAAELEHNLLCCYLYAAFSLKRRGQPGINDAQADVVEAWRASIMQVAMEEMVHLALVANLTVSVGATPHFNRPNMPVAPLYHPADIVVELAPFCVDTLDHFIFLERPEGSEVADGQSFADLAVDYHRGAHPAASVMPSAVDYETIGDFYERLRQNIQSLADLGDDALFCGGAALQIGPEQLDFPGIQTVTSLSDAMSVIDTVVTQGEGSRADHDESHFSRFQTIRKELLALSDGDDDFEPAWPAARNPLMRRPAAGSRGVHVSGVQAARVLDLANAVYALMLRSLSAAWGKGPERIEGSLSADEALDTAMRLMGLVAAFGAHLCTLPLTDDNDNDNAHAGLTFTMIRATEPVLGHCEKQWLQESLDDILAASRSVVAAQPALAPAVDKIAVLRKKYR